MLHLAIEPGTDMVLFNAILTEIAAKGWQDKAFIAASTNEFDKVVAANKTTLAEAAQITGLKAEDIAKAAAWIAEPKDGKRRRAMFCYEKGLIWGNDNYRTNAALVNVALATGNLGRPGGGCVRMGGHQEGYSRPSDAHVGRPAAYVDKLLIEGKGGVHHIWACDHYKTTLERAQVQAGLQEAHRHREGRDERGAGRRQPALVAAIVDAIKKGGLFAVDVDIVPTKIGEACHVWLPAATSGEMNLTSMNGERRMRLTERVHGPPRRVHARLSCRGAHCQQHGARAARAWRCQVRRPVQGLRLEDRRRRLHGRLCTSTRRAGSSSPTQRLRAMGTNGFQEPATDFKDGKIVGTKRLFADGKFGGKDGKATFMEAKWRGLQAPGKEEQKAKFKYLVNNGRTNHVWQNAYLDQDNEFVMDRWPYPFIEMNPDDMAELEVAAGDLVEVFNDDGSTQAMAYPDADRQEGPYLHALRLPDRRAGQCRQCRHQRTDPAQLQADLGQHPKTRLGARERQAPELQEPGIQDGLMFLHGWTRRLSPTRPPSSAPPRVRHADCGHRDACGDSIPRGPRRSMPSCSPSAMSCVCAAFISAGVLQSSHGTRGQCASSVLVTDLRPEKSFDIWDRPRHRRARMPPRRARPARCGTGNHRRDRRQRVDLLVMNRFGRAESLGRGLVGSFTAAIEAGIPILTAVRPPYDDAWHAFHGGIGCELMADPGIVMTWALSATVPFSAREISIA